MIVLFWQRTVARLRRPAIVASVAMNGGSRSRLIIKAWTSPMVDPMSRVRPMASAIKPVEGGAGRSVAQPLGQELGADDRRQRDDGPGREVDPAGDDHHCRADGQHAEKGDRDATASAGCSSGRTRRSRSSK